MAACSSKSVTENNLQVPLDDEGEAAENETGSTSYKGCRLEVQAEIKKCLADFKRTLELKTFTAVNVSNVNVYTKADDISTTATPATTATLELANNFATILLSKSDEREQLMKLKWEAEMETVKTLRKELSEAKDSIFREKIEQLNKEKNEVEGRLTQEREERKAELNERAKLLEFLEHIKQVSHFSEEGNAELVDETESVASHVRKMLSEECENEKEVVLGMNHELRAENHEEQVFTSSCEETFVPLSTLLPPPILELEKSMEEVEDDIGNTNDKPTFALSETPPTPKLPLPPIHMRHCKSSKDSRMCICGMKFKTVKKLKEHLLLHWKFECVMCTERFFGLTHLKRHMSKGHGISDPLRGYMIGCRKCGKMFPSRAKYHKHHKAVHSTKRRKGNVCREYEVAQQNLAISSEGLPHYERNSSDDEYSDIPILENEMEKY